MFGLFKKNKLVKLRSLNQTQRYGVAATSLKELIKKGCKILQVAFEGSHICLYEDGTCLTQDYFMTLPDNAELVLLVKDEKWNGFVCDISRLLSSTDRHSEPLVQAARALLCDELSPKRRQILGHLLLHLEDRSDAEHREEDQDWFQGVDVRFKTKSAYMKYNCESRVRGYMKEVDSYTQTIQKPQLRMEYQKAAACLTTRLKSDKYNGCYFDRREKETSCLCTREGWFTCQGAFDQDECKSLHSINPYGNRESRILFSTWNLDHRIEKKRTVIPALAAALQNQRSSDINLDYFYRLLFTRDNLRLVHIVCHKKGSHDLPCDSKRIYRRGKRK